MLLDRDHAAWTAGSRLVCARDTCSNSFVATSSTNHTVPATQLNTPTNVAPHTSNTRSFNDDRSSSITTFCIHTNSSATILVTARHSHAPICILSTSSDHQSTPLTRNNIKFFTTLPPRNGQYNLSLSMLVSHFSFSIVPHLYVGVFHPTTTSHRFHVSTTNITTSNIRNTWVHTNHMT